MKAAIRGVLGNLHRLAGRSSAVARVAVKVRNQANAVVAAHLSGVESPAANGEYALIDRVAPGAHNFIDVGANAGDWSARFLERMGRTGTGLVVDANSRCIDALRGRLAGHPEVAILDAALSDYCGSASFFEATGTASALSSLTEVKGGAGAMVPRLVRVTTLDEEVASLGWSRVSMLKIDAEGHDFFVLRGARGLLSEKRVDFVQFECNSTWNAVGVSIVAAAAFLASLGYRLFQLQPAGVRPVDVAYFRDCGSANWVALHEKSPDVGLRIGGELG